MSDAAVVKGYEDLSAYGLATQTEAAFLRTQTECTLVSSTGDG